MQSVDCWCRMLDKWGKVPLAWRKYRSPKNNNIIDRLAMQFPKMVVRFLALAGVSVLAVSCAYIIPNDPNQPRNNAVVGERHKPQMNTLVPQSSLAPGVNPLVNAPQVAARNLPPVDAATQAAAEKELAAAPAAVSSMERRVPIENAEFQVSAAGYPPITSVPPRPVMAEPESAKERLGEVQSTLEQDRAAAEVSKEKLARDAAAEPSMLPAPVRVDGVVPPADPVTVAPVVNGAATAPAALPSVTIPTPEAVRPGVAPVANKPGKPEAAAEPAADAVKPEVVGNFPVFPATPVPTVTAPPVAAAVISAPPSAAPMPAAPVLVAPPITLPPPAPLGKVAMVAPAVPAQPAPAVQPVPQVVAVAPAPVQAPAPVVSTPPAAQVATAVPATPRRVRGDFDPLAVADTQSVRVASPVTTGGATTSSSYAANRYLSPSRYAVRQY